MKLATLIVLILCVPLTLYAQPSPKPTPAVSGNFCVNNSTGTVRNVLLKNGIAQPCHKNEQTVAIINFDSAPTPTPQPSATPSAAPSSSATATPSPTATPVGMSGTVIDSNGKVVGQLDQDSSDAQQGSIVDINIAGVPLGLLISRDGFVDEQLNGVQLTLWYTSTDCTGQPYIIVGGDGNGLDIQPLVEVAAVQRGPYVYGNTLQYAAEPWTEVTMKSLQAFADPTQPSTSGCENAGNTAPNLGTWLAGPRAGFNLSTLGLVPPFEVQ